jgi:EAL domain-containing protein (putative c-di-GMP-specific phosphodiesterase class I)/GGDEF domain-containing protein
MAPSLVGWVVFVARLNEQEMNALERLSAIPLQASVQIRTREGWRGADGPRREESAAISAFIDAALQEGAAPRALRGPGGDAIALVKPLRSLGRDEQVVLLLRYPLALALAPYRPLAGILLAIGALGLGALVVGSWLLARGLTRPLSALEDAARKVQSGEDASVEVSSRDEIGHLAATFNAMAADIRDRERRIMRQALIDPETHLPNRLALERRLARPRGGDVKGLIVLAALGVDRFAHIRTAIGYNAAGDLIGKIGARLRKFRPDGAVARLSTEALGLAFDAADEESARRAAIEILAALERPVSLSGHRVDVNLTIGLAADSVHLARALSLIDRANVALDQARATHRKVAFFDSAAYGDPLSNLSLMSDMGHALESGEMQVCYEPKLDIRAAKITGVEALVGWRHPTRGVIEAEVFEPMAEETGHIRGLTEWVLARVVEDQAALAARGRDLSISVNVSGRLLTDDDFAAAAIAAARSAPGKICFEVAETALIENTASKLKSIDRLARAGPEIAIDNYGAGLSGMSYLKRTCAHELKIDKELVFGVQESERDALFIRSTIDLAHSLGLKITAEGVEEPDVLAALAGMGCDRVQGRLISAPLPLNELLRFLEDDHRVRRLVRGRGEAA